MLAIDEAREVTEVWNLDNPQHFTPWEVVEECILSLLLYRFAVGGGSSPETVSGLVDRHNDFARRVPDGLLYILSDGEL